MSVYVAERRSGDSQFRGCQLVCVSVQNVPTSGLGVIRANPDQSKHLETATMRLHGLSLDLVHLRSETYTDASRIPEIEIGTPEEDALRRDFTVNALFYNLQTREVEDWTRRGLEDLRAGVIRTPLEPKVTFLDGAPRAQRNVSAHRGAHGRAAAKPEISNLRSWMSLEIAACS